MSKSDACENGILLLLFKNTNFANIGDATGLRGSSTAGSLYLTLHTADPGEAGDQTTNEITNYTRGLLGRAPAGNFVVTNNTVSYNLAGRIFRSSGGDVVVTHWGLGTASSGAGVLLYSAALSSSVTISSTKPFRLPINFNYVSED